MATLREMRCPDAALVAAVDTKRTYGKLRLATLTTTTLDDLVDRGQTTFDTKYELGFLDSGGVSGLKIGSAAAQGYNDNTYRLGEMRKNSGTYLGVYSVLEDSPPKVIAKQGFVTGENLFEQGRFEAWLVVYDVETATAACQMHVRAESSEDVKWKERGLTKKTFEDARMADYVKQIKIAAKQAVARQSSKIDLGYSTIL